jgi:hypothetical protein
MAYNPEFQINPEQLEIIEEALRAEIGRLAKPCPVKWNEKNPEKENAKKIREVLGHLHNQKRWYNPKEVVPLG